MDERQGFARSVSDNCMGQLQNVYEGFDFIFGQFVWIPFGEHPAKLERCRED